MWISVKDRLPEIDQFVLWYYPGGCMTVFEIDKDMEFGHQPPEIDFAPALWPTHWQPLPEPPEE